MIKKLTRTSRALVVRDVERFSSIDLSTNTKVGIVFPLSNPDNQLSISSIVNHDTAGYTNLGCTEARTANQVDDDTVSYIKHPCIGFVSMPKQEEEQVPLACQLIQHTVAYHIAKPLQDYYVKDMPVFNDIDSEMLKEISECYRDLIPNTQFIKAENVEKKQYFSYKLEGDEYDLMQTL